MKRAANIKEIKHDYLWGAVIFDARSAWVIKGDKLIRCTNNRFEVNMN